MRLTVVLVAISTAKLPRRPAPRGGASHVR